MRLSTSRRALTQAVLVYCSAAALSAAPTWLADPSVLGSVNINQGYAASYPVGPVIAAPEFGLAFQLVHGTGGPWLLPAERDQRFNELRKRAGLALLPPPKTQPGKKLPPPEKIQVFRSEWSIPQLSNYVYPANRDRVIWRQPNGGEIIFNREDMTASPARFSPEGWRCEEDGAGAYVIRDRDGWIWRYKDGLPATLTAPSGRYLEFTHDKGLLVRIVQRLSVTDKGSMQEVLRVAYDNERRPVRLQSGPHENRFEYDKVTGHLVAWYSTGFALASASTARASVNTSRPESDPAINLESTEPPPAADSGLSMGAMRFLYLEDLLAATRLPNGKIERLRWEVGRGILLADAHSTYERGREGAEVSITRIDRENRRVTVRYDGAREEMTTVAPDGTSNVTAYQRRSAGRGLMKERRDRDGRLLQAIDYNARHLPVRIRTLGEPEIRNVYDERDRLVEVWRRPSEPLEGAKSGAGSKVSSTTQAVAGELWQRFTYEGANRKPSTATDAAGRTTRYFYDERGQLERMIAPDGGAYRYRFDAWGRLLVTELPGNLTEIVKYDDQGRLVERKGTDGAAVTLQYDGAGRISQRTENNVLFTYQYASDGRPSHVLRNQKRWGKWDYGSEILTLAKPARGPTNWRNGPPSLEVTTVSFTDARGFTTKRTFDSDGRLVEIVNPLNERTSYRYNKVGEPLGWIDPRGNALWFTRDDMGRIVRQENALGQVLTWSFDGAGRLETRTNGVQRAQYRYDIAGRLKEIDYGNGQTVKYERDGYGRLLSASTAEVVTRYAYDALDRVTRIEQHPKKGAASGVAYTYAIGGQKADVSVLEPGAAGALAAVSTTQTTYDLLGRVTSIALDGVITARHLYEGTTPHLTSKYLGNGLCYRYTYDEAGRMARLEVVDREGKPRQRLIYDWDDFGLLASRTLERPIKDTPDEWQRIELNYGYDEVGRLAAVTSPQDPKQNRRYRYDGTGNLVENRAPDRWLTMEYDAANQLVTKTERAEDGSPQAGEITRFEYDPAGRMTREIQGREVERSFTYGYLDKVLAVDRAGGRHADYVYDASGMLVSKSARDPGAAAVPQQETWVWDGLALVRRGDEVFVNEAHVAGGAALMSRTLREPTGSVPASP